MWASIIERMYDHKDCLDLEEIFHSAIQRRIESGFGDWGNKVDTKGKMSREERISLLASKDSRKLLWSEFLKCILDYQLTQHEAFLFKFHSLFKRLDSDTNGILNEAEFSRLIKEIGICDSDPEISYFLQMIDPFNNNSITFSEIVQLLSQHMVPLSTSD